jgi:hypothetical protein
MADTGSVSMPVLIDVWHGLRASTPSGPAWATSWSAHEAVWAELGVPEELGPVPANAVVAEFVPQPAILERADLLVSHSGSGTMLGGLVHGVPQVAVPRGTDQPQNAAPLARAGAGVVVAPEDYAVTPIRAAVAQVTGDPAFRAAAARIRDEIAAMPDADAAWSDLSARSHRRLEAEQRAHCGSCSAGPPPASIQSCSCRQHVRGQGSGVMTAVDRGRLRCRPARRRAEALVNCNLGTGLGRRPRPVIHPLAVSTRSPARVVGDLVERRGCPW